MPTWVWLIGWLLVAHAAGDFSPLASRRIQLAKATGGPVGPIAMHAAIHAILTGVAVAVVGRPSPQLLLAAVALQFVSHFAIDAARARLGVRYRALTDPSSDVFWWALGVDQLLHGLVLVGIAALVLA